MALLGQGEGHGGISILHALGAGYGATIGIDLTTKIRLRDNEPSKTADDPHGLLDAVVEVWKSAGLEVPADNLYWQSRSTIPVGMGLKSSAAASVAAIRALCEATETELGNDQIVDLAVQAQLMAGVSFTGSLDDAWAAVEPGWKIVDPNQPASESIVLSGDIPDANDWKVMIILRGSRDYEIDPARFQLVGHQFEKAIQAVEQGNILVAMTENGRAVASAIDDPGGRRLSNDLFVWGARAGGITGSGPALTAILPSNNESTLKRIEQYVRQRGLDIIITDFWVE